jgi:hypothetical protein
MIDCVLAIEPTRDMSKAIRDYFETAPSEFESINHTNYTPLLQRPIGVNIEVKRAGGDIDKAEVQCAVWVAAQFNRLEKLVAGVREAQSLEWQAVQLQLQEQEPPPPPPLSPHLPQRVGEMSLGTTTSASGSTTIARDASATTPASTCSAPSSATGVSTHNTDNGPAAAPAMIPFLPLIIVQGHEWHFLAATRSVTGRTVCYNLRPLPIPCHLSQISSLHRFAVACLQIRLIALIPSGGRWIY